MKTLNEMSNSELEEFVKKERLDGTDMERLLDYIQDQTIDNLFRKANLYQFVRVIYKIPKDEISTIHFKDFQYVK